MSKCAYRSVQGANLNTPEFHQARPCNRAGLRAGKRGTEHAPGAHAGGKRRADAAAAGGAAKRGASAADADAEAEPGNRRCLQCGTQVWALPDRGCRDPQPHNLVAPLRVWKPRM